MMNRKNDTDTVFIGGSARDKQSKNVEDIAKQSVKQGSELMVETKIGAGRNTRSTVAPSHIRKVAESDDIGKIAKVGDDVAKELRDARFAMKLNQQQLAHLSSVPLDYIKAMERGEAKYDAKNIQKIKKALNLTNPNKPKTEEKRQPIKKGKK